MTTDKKREELFHLADSVIDSLFTMSDEEILSQMDADGVCVEDADRAFDSLIDSARMAAGREILARARAELDSNCMSAVFTCPMTVNDARMFVTHFVASEGGITKAARNGCAGDLSDHEVLDLVNDLRTLGVRIPRTNVP